MRINNWIITLIGVTVFGAFAWAIIPGNNKEDIKDDSKINFDKLDEVVFDVRATPANRGNLILYINANGTVRANEELEITANINGIIKDLSLYEGKNVKSGDFLLGLDDREYEIALNDAKGRIAEARIEYELIMKEDLTEKKDNPQAVEILNQVKALEAKFKAGQINESNFNELKDQLELKLIFTGAKREEIVMNKSGLTGAINAHKRAKLNYEYTKIFAPFSGIIGDFDLIKGQRINAGQKLCKLFNTSSLKIDVGVLGSDISKINLNGSAKITIPSLPGQVFTGKVANISPYIAKESKTCKVTIQIQNETQKIKPGMFAKVNIETSNLTDRLLIPKQAILIRDKRPLVFVADRGLAKWIYVEVGEQNDEYAEILNGLKGGESVITEGQYTLAHDARVKVIK